MVAILVCLAIVFLQPKPEQHALAPPPQTTPPPVTPTEQAPPPEPSCLTLDAFIANPAITALRKLQADWSGSNEPIEPFLNVDLDVVERRANGGDMAAMTVMAIAARLEAADEDPGYAVPLLLHGGKPDNSWIEDLSLDVSLRNTHGDLTADQVSALERAMNWYYRLATHGQFSALSSYGELFSRLNPDPVALGWIERERYDALSPILRTLYEPRRLYFDIAGRLFYREKYTPRYVDQLPDDDRANRQALLERLEASFWDDLVALEPGTPEELEAMYDAARPVHAQACPGVVDAYSDWLNEQRYRWPQPAEPDD